MQLSDFFPAEGRTLLSGGAKQFIERIGIDAAKNAIQAILLGDNVRSQTEHLTRNRLAQLSAAILVMFARGQADVPDFTNQISKLAVSQLKNRRGSKKENIWLAQWLLGLTNKSVQNVLRDDSAKLDQYSIEFEKAMESANESARSTYGDLKLMIELGSSDVALDWSGFTRLMTMVGSQTLAIRGSEKSMFGKLFERLVLGSALQILGFTRVRESAPKLKKRLFWLSDGRAGRSSESDLREWDARVLVEPGKIVRIDIGFIGKGNPEIARDKLSRFARQVELSGRVHESKTVIIVDRLPISRSTEAVAQAGGVEIIQMSMQYWIRDLAIAIRRHYPVFKHPIEKMTPGKISQFVAAQLRTIQIQEFVSGLSAPEVETE